jgi:hypothetical protein
MFNYTVKAQTNARDHSTVSRQMPRGKSKNSKLFDVLVESTPVTENLASLLSIERAWKVCHVMLFAIVLSPICDVERTSLAVAWSGKIRP